MVVATVALFEVLALGSGRLSLGDGIQDGVQVGQQLLCTERSLAHGHMDDVLLVQTVLDLTPWRR